MIKQEYDTYEVKLAATFCFISKNVYTNNRTNSCRTEEAVGASVNQENEDRFIAYDLKHCLFIPI